MTPLRTFLTAVAVAAVTAAPASAGPDFEYTGDCGYEAAAAPSALTGDPDTFRGVLYGYAVLYSPSDPTVQVSGTVTCTLSFADGSSFAATSSGTSFVYATEEIAFTADHPFDQAQFCQTVDFRDDGEAARTTCYEFTAEQVPPQELRDVVDDVLATVPGSGAALCAVLRAVEPFVPDVWLGVMLTEDGDLFVGKHRFWYCP